MTLADLLPKSLPAAWVPVAPPLAVPGAKAWRVDDRKVIASLDTEGGARWYHVSVSAPYRDVSGEEVRALAALLYGPGDAIELWRPRPPERMAWHLWRRIP